MIEPQWKGNALFQCTICQQIDPPEEISLDIERTLMKLQQMALFPWHGHQLDQFPGRGFVSLLDMLGGVKWSNRLILSVKDTLTSLKRVLVSYEYPSLDHWILPSILFQFHFNLAFFIIYWSKRLVTSCWFS